jgi:GAF domain-containing protein
VDSTAPFSSDKVNSLTTLGDASKYRLEDVLATRELDLRPRRPSELMKEVAALQDLAQALAHEDLPSIRRRALVHAIELCRAGTAGVSFREGDANQGALLRWVAVAGILESAEGKSHPMHSPCGIAMTKVAPQLFLDPALYFEHLQDLMPKMTEVLTVPFVSGNRVLGTIWVTSHGRLRRFDREDVRLLTSLGHFVGAACRMTLPAAAAA